MEGVISRRPSGTRTDRFGRSLTFLKTLPPLVMIVMLTALSLGIGYLDYRTGTDTTFSAIYLFPIVAAAWFVSLPFAYGLAVLCSILWVSGDIEAGAHYGSLWVPLWNLACRFGIFVFSAHLLAALRRLHNNLEKRALERAKELTKEIAMRERLQRELLQISEREQERVGHDIHDSLCQHLTGTALAAEVLAENLESEHSAERKNASRVVELVEEAIAQARNLARGLNAVEVSKNGLMAALNDFACSTSDLFNVSCRFECAEPFEMDDLNSAVHLYRIAQEAVGNAIKHGEARNVVIELENSASQRVLRVIDNGRGLSSSVPSGKGMGLRIMSYRAALIGAQFDIRRRGSTGTEVTCTIPFVEAAQ
jgi:signal transduction histidine kinase